MPLDAQALFDLSSRWLHAAKADEDPAPGVKGEVHLAIRQRDARLLAALLRRHVRRLPEPPAWMLLGFELFQALEKIGTTYEAFPSASYAMLEDDPSLVLTVNFSNVRKGKTDMLDAWMAAATVREFVEGRGMDVGGSDALGTIILPRRLKQPICGVLKQP